MVNVRKLRLKLRKFLFMAKNAPKGKRCRGNPNRSGKSPYQKYAKTPYRYSSDYYAWFNSIRNNKPVSSKKGWKSSDRQYIREYREAAE